ncbi:LOB domain-containing protein 25-like protein [Carex littledalei]|uniref:LOB domain-containing protein 25-like protein n=1 Tax=Carex littledalei TaxID=544730 RepID=A0A833VMM6_9POAL|nr:LOB domain-containing protein 25-like protein [Carex littledalei]
MGSDSRVSGMPELPCAACRLLHRKCSPDCILAPHFPTDQPNKFVIVHKVFGASTVVKMLQTLVEATREDAVKSLVYEANARLQDPVYGCTSAVIYLQNYIQQLQSQLTTTRDQVTKLQEQNYHLLQVLMEMSCTDPTIMNSSLISSTVYNTSSTDSCQIYNI